MMKHSQDSAIIAPQNSKDSAHFAARDSTRLTPQDSARQALKARDSIDSARHDSAQSLVFLAQSDTTAGFLSKSAESIIEIKGNSRTKPLLMEVSEIGAIREFSRIPHSLNRAIRRAQKTTFIFNHRAFRIVREARHLVFLKRYKWLFSSSANHSGEKFCYDFAYNAVGVIVLDSRQIRELTPSTLLAVGKNRIKKLR